MKPKIAIVRGAFLNKFEMQFFEPLQKKFDITVFSSMHPFHDQFAFPVIKLPSPMDVPQFPYKMPILNRMFIDAHYLFGLEDKLNGFDLVHTAETYYRYTQQSLNAKKNGKVKKVIATVLENIPHNNEGIWGRKSYKQRSREELDHIIALTELTKKALLIEGTSQSKITVISHFIDTKRFLPVSKYKNTSTLVILFCGRLEVYKGVLDILFAANELVQDSDIKVSLLFRFVGDGSQRRVMEKYIKENCLEKYIEFNSISYDQMPNIYNNADIYVAPSKSSKSWIEQYNTTLLEAQASGLPIVTTNSGGIPENVGDAAILITPGNVNELVNAIKELILSAESRIHFGKRARERAVKVHDIAIGAQKIETLWNNVLG